MRVEDSLSMHPREVGKPGNGRPAREAGLVEEEQEEPEADMPSSVCGMLLKDVGLLLRGLDVGVVVVARCWL